MTKYIDNPKVGVEPPTKAERRYIQAEREQQEYEAMYDKVWLELSIDESPVSGMEVHTEVMRRLKEKNKQDMP